MSVFSYNLKKYFFFFFYHSYFSGEFQCLGGLWKTLILILYIQPLACYRALC